jgi:DNA-binding NarL/FixJ family response regulator
MSAQQAVCLLVEDQAQARGHLAAVLAKAFTACEVVAVGSLREARSWLDGRARDSSAVRLLLALIDLGLPDGCGVELVRELAAAEPDVPSVIMTIYGDDAHLFDALAAGARGYLLKEDEPELHAEILRRIERDEPPLSPKIARRLMAHFGKPAEAAKADPPAALTSRERETLALLARGLTVAEAAAKLGLSAQTVAGYVKVIYQKLRVSNRAQVTREAVKLGLV